MLTTGLFASALAGTRPRRDPGHRLLKKRGGLLLTRSRHVKKLCGTTQVEFPAGPAGPAEVPRDLTGPERWSFRMQNSEFLADAEAVVMTTGGRGEECGS